MRITKRTIAKANDLISEIQKLEKYLETIKSMRRKEDAGQYGGITIIADKRFSYQKTCDMIFVKMNPIIDGIIKGLNTEINSLYEELNNLKE